MNYTSIKSITILVLLPFASHLPAEFIPKCNDIPLTLIQDNEKKAWYVPTEQKAKNLGGASATAIAAGYIGYRLFAEHADPHGQRSSIVSCIQLIAVAASGLFSAYITDNKKLSSGAALLGFFLGIGHAQHKNNPPQPT